MKLTLRMALVALALAPLTPVHAADYDPPIYVDQAPDYVPVEVGSGWYLRGDIGYAFSHPFDNHQDASGFSSSSTLFDGSVGMGYHFNDYLRAELNFGILPSNKFGDELVTTCDGSITTTVTSIATSTIVSQTNAAAAPPPPCRGTNFANNKAYSLMANGYVDLGTYVGITPYLGGGVGLAYSKLSRAIGARDCVPTTTTSTAGGLQTVQQFNCDDPAGYEGAVTSKSSYDFAYSLAAGLSYQVTKNVSVDLGYEYFAVPGMKYVAYDGGAFGIHKGVNYQSVKLGLRYDLW
ncbi:MULTISPECIES: outer membrane beta-barrel protein [unclassified Mesorhizobium]|uniref:outer membrane protein n=1 Tax=unclassified Mesorhizobium TaxID=325217 RepID=UPI000F74C0CC|nr:MULTISPECIES: outer membrane beta-barrel protein [unclassified Mesorhizobium]AZO39702.1 porin family protein [Mesorhizobium sp. M7D.F.Ca.US.005.01.1.1]RUX93835.1 porin family protein [Mesorhizobium sp. M7D.F.Ca.US.004.01.2.1]RVA29170.1 porin family protein [Mesorhizobium sp. M7D.F.Ca.US.004.03.1.1]